MDTRNNTGNSRPKDIVTYMLNKNKGNMKKAIAEADELLGYMVLRAVLEGRISHENAVEGLYNLRNPK